MAIVASCDKRVEHLKTLAILACSPVTTTATSVPAIFYKTEENEGRILEGFPTNASFTQ